MVTIGRGGAPGEERSTATGPSCLFDLASREGVGSQAPEPRRGAAGGGVCQSRTRPVVFSRAEDQQNHRNCVGGNFLPAFFGRPRFNAKPESSGFVDGLSGMEQEP
jgi:hypothetical protein